MTTMEFIRDNWGLALNRPWIIIDEYGKGWLCMPVTPYSAGWLMAKAEQFDISVFVYKGDPHTVKIRILGQDVYNMSFMVRHMTIQNRIVYFWQHGEDDFRFNIEWIQLGDLQAGSYQTKNECVREAFARIRALETHID